MGLGELIGGTSLIGKNVLFYAFVWGFISLFTFL